MSGSPKKVTPLDRHVGSRITELRKARRLTQTDLARLLGVTMQQVQKYECGTNRVSAARLWMMAQHLDVRIGYFFRGAPTGG